MVANPDAVVDKATVVVHLENTGLAFGAVVGPGWLHTVAYVAFSSQFCLVFVGAGREFTGFDGLSMFFWFL